MKHEILRRIAVASLILGTLTSASLAADSPSGADISQGFSNPPASARLRAYWWWLNGNATKTAITRDLEEMKAKGFGGAVVLASIAAALIARGAFRRRV